MQHANPNDQFVSYAWVQCKQTTKLSTHFIYLHCMYLSINAFRNIERANINSGECCAKIHCIAADRSHTWWLFEPFFEEHKSRFYAMQTTRTASIQKRWRKGEKKRAMERKRVSETHTRCMFAHMKCTIGRILRDIKMFLFSPHFFRSFLFHHVLVVCLPLFEFANVSSVGWHVVLSVVYEVFFSSSHWRSSLFLFPDWIVDCRLVSFFRLCVSFFVVVVVHHSELTYSSPNCFVCVLVLFPYLLLSNIWCPKELVPFDSFFWSTTINNHGHCVSICMLVFFANS